MAVVRTTASRELLSTSGTKDTRSARVVRGGPVANPIALGVRAGTGRGDTGMITVVGVRGADPYALKAVGRWEVDLVVPGGAGQVYHRAKRLEVGERMRVLDAARDHAHTAAQVALRAIIAQCTTAGHMVRGIALPTEAGAERIDVTPEQILASRRLIQVAEAVLYSEAMAEAARNAGVPTVRVGPGELPARSKAAVAGSAEDTDDLVRRFGTALGRPWRRPQRDAAAAALVAWGAR